MKYRFVIYQVDQGVGKILLNRPEVLNSFNRDMAREVQGAFSQVEEDQTVRAVLLSGAGRAFCAGQDLTEAMPPSETTPPDIGDIVRESYSPIIRAIRKLEKPVVCAVNGVAAGAGANIALACDFVLAAETASFIQAFCKIGLIPDSGGTFFLPRLVGLARANALMMLGEKITARQAQEMGMIYKVYEDSVLMEEASKLAQHLAIQPTVGLGLIKRAVNCSFTNSLDAQLDLEGELQSLVGKTEDYREGVQAFLQKRKPKFSGR